jgi:hypothetical protein
MFRSLKTLCTDTVATVEAQLKSQKQSDVAEARSLQEEAKARAEEEMRQQLAEAAAARERSEMMGKTMEEEMDIIHIERQLQAKKAALTETQKAAGMDIDDADDDEESDSAHEEQVVHYLFMFLLYSILITFNPSIRGPIRKSRCVRRKRLARRCPR